ncbi:hypothetical protein L1049_003507 [Liquidambar formosana]|uniref:Uncharacterized protein n=1 Tax=Liquidambar formosana TaxID=63359 RepID=A0AAP0N4S0_LIQFO
MTYTRESFALLQKEMETGSVCRRISSYVLLILLLLEALSSNSSVAAAGVIAQNNYESGQCNGSISECGESAEEGSSMESEISRTLLEATIYITAAALKRNLPACGGGAGGKPYSNSCLPPPTNIERRGCSKYYRCRK